MSVQVFVFLLLFALGFVVGLFVFTIGARFLWGRK